MVRPPPLLQGLSALPPDIDLVGPILIAAVLFIAALLPLVLGPDQPAYRAQQVYQALYRQPVSELTRISTLPGTLRDRLAAENFTAGAERAGVRRVIYLGGLGDTGDELSEHLASRREVAAILAAGRFSTTILRAAVIIGAGGASFEMIRSLVERLPVMVTPRWVSTRCQPIAVGDVIRYLVGCLADERTAGETFDIGGPDIISYRDMMEQFARLEQRPLLIIPVPFLTPRLSSYWVGLITPVRPSISMPLIEGVKNEVVCRDLRIRDLLPFPLTPYAEAVKIALAEGGNSA